MFLEAFKFRPRLLLASAVGLVIVLLLPGSLPWLTRFLVAWSSSITLYMLLIIIQFSRASIDKIREQASRLDDSAPVILVIAMVATIASFGAIFSLLLAPSESPSAKIFEIALGSITMVLSWAFIQTVFAIHYTHIFYGDEDGTQRGGLVFGGDDDEPDFWDFLYFTTSIGAAAQTSDTVVSSKIMRRIVTAQAVYSFFFNTAVLALAINIAAGLAGH